MIQRHPELQVGINDIVTESRIGEIDPQIARTAVEAQNYIEYLEGKEDRLTTLENILNDLAEKNDPATNEFLKAFDVLIVA